VNPVDDIRPEHSGGMRLLTLATVGELTPRPHAKVDAGARLAHVVDQMKAKGRGCVLVEEDGALVGIFTERDLVGRVDHGDRAWIDVLVRDVMTPMPMVSRSSDSLAEAMRRMVEGKRRHLPIVDDHGQVKGLISVRDILAFVASRFPEEMMNLPPEPSHES
jgi:signal-transduction protein with cAMP-binding, CBS, and nucleotidyltransferase domain